MARCPTCGTEATGCDCSVLDTDCFEITGSGSEANPFGVQPILDPDADNLLSCGVNGLMAELPSYISDPPTVSVFRSIATSIANDTTTVVQFSSVNYDTDNMHETVTNPSRITFTTAGIYIITFNCMWDKDPDGDRAAYIRKNGLSYLGIEAKHAGDADLFVGHSLTIQDNFGAGTFIECLVKQDSGAALNLIVSEFSPTFTATFRRRAP